MAPTTHSACVLLWLRRDLRLDDNPALQAALETGLPVVPVFIHAPEEESPWQPGAASRWWLHHSIVSLDARLRERGSRLIVRRGESRAVLSELTAECDAVAVHWSRLYEPATIARDTAVKSALKANCIEAKSFNGALLFEPWTVQTKSGTPYQVFTPFWRMCQELPECPVPFDAPERIPAPKCWPRSDAVESLGLLPQVDWAGGMRKAWKPGEIGAVEMLRSFLSGAANKYAEGRDRPDHPGTSRLSPHLHFGEMSPRRLWHAVRRAAPTLLGEGAGGHDSFIRQVAWREFAHHLLFHFPHTAEVPLRAEFADFPWRDDDVALRRWQRGQTGYPIVDAGMRELWETGWMHNRARMMVASFLVKDLMIPWQTGARWFWDTLVDADLAQNTLGWQWAAGCGADAAPYFRVFNPITQGEKFDPEGDYVRRHVPELRAMPPEWIHKSWMAPPMVLQSAGVRLGESHSAPMVDHARARDAALEAYHQHRKTVVPASRPIR